ncbi:LOW QUALITY PROTEIN: D-alanyl-D-alanine carboxypeptidase [Geomicrobium sp. JCM 19037]|nr:LOW QUALITY PROTEIN: D-alanyl-D-alanine carboxypeptidase [Geomicrobium sp. JCM 19037]
MARFPSIYAAVFLFSVLLVGCADTDEEPVPEETSEQPEQEEVEDEQSAEATTNPWAIEEEHFNVIEEVDGRAVIQNPDNPSVLVNHDYALPEDYSPDDLVVPDVLFFFDEDVEKRYLRAPAADALEDLFAAAEEDGYHLFAVSGYRSFDRQDAIFTNAATERGEDAASETIAYPGNSEHQTGLAMDVSSESNSFLLSEEFGATPEGEWVEENAHHYGFVIRYPDHKVDITEISYEPWHLRYVGTDIAEILVEHDLVLEEFFEKAVPM